MRLAAEIATAACEAGRIGIVQAMDATLDLFACANNYWLPLDPLLASVKAEIETGSTEVLEYLIGNHAENIFLNSYVCSHSVHKFFLTSFFF